jgi:hypothetical protein
LDLGCSARIGWYWRLGLGQARTTRIFARTRTPAQGRLNFRSGKELNRVLRLSEKARLPGTTPCQFCG